MELPVALIDDIEVDLSKVEWTGDMPMPMGWRRSHFRFGKGNAVAQLFYHLATKKWQVDLFALDDVNLGFVDEMMKPEFYRPCRRGVGIGIDFFSSKQFGPLWTKVDIDDTHSAGSPRNGFFFDSNPIPEWDLSRFIRWQLMRGHQSPDDDTGLFSPLVGKSLFTGCPVYQIDDTILDMITVTDESHFTVGWESLAVRRYNDMRALDQLTRKMGYAIATIGYFRDAETTNYGGAERILGWWLMACMDAIEAYEHAGLINIRDFWVNQFLRHVKRAKAIGFNECGLPNIAHAPDPGRHLPTKFNQPWQGSIVAVALVRFEKKFKVKVGAEQWVKYIVNEGWDHLLGCFDSTSNDCADDTYKTAGLPGIGEWLCAVHACGQQYVDSLPMAKYIIGKATPKGWKNDAWRWYGELISKSPEEILGKSGSVSI